MIAFRGVRAFDGQRLTEPRDVFVADGLVVDHLEGAEEIDARGKALLPGFIDAHVHLDFFSPSSVVRAGVTTARDLGWPLDRIRALALADDGPAVLYAGPMLTAPGGYPARARWAPAGTALEVADEEEARDAVARLGDAGASIIKIAQPAVGPSLPAEMVRAIVVAAHDLSLRVTSHCGALRELDIAMDAGVDELAHGLWSNERIPDDVIARMVGAGMTVIPTLHIDPSPQRIDNLARYREAGGRIVYGTDMGNEPVPPGIDVEELKLMERAGLSKAEAIAAATTRAAAWLELDDRGVIAEGMRADLVLVEGDPLERLEVLARPVMVLRGGVAA